MNAGRFFPLAARAVSGFWVAILFLATTSASARTLSPIDAIPTSPSETRARNFFDASSGLASTVRHETHGIATGSEAGEYESALGRRQWLNRDPIGEAGGINLYGFVANDPINLLDPFGESIVGKICVLGAKGIKKVFKKGLTMDEALAAQKAGDDILMNSRKAAKELAEKAGGGQSPIHEIDKKTGSPHYHPADRSGGHILYSAAAALTFSHYAASQGSFLEGAAFVGDLFNPLSLPQDLIDIGGVIFGD